MTVKVAINGFGRIGRNVLRAIVESGRKDIAVVAINDLGPVETNAHLLRFDSVHGKFPGEVKSGAGLGGRPENTERHLAGFPTELRGRNGDEIGILTQRRVPNDAGVDGPEFDVVGDIVDGGFEHLGLG
mgnify:CR=1 FL=1